MTTDSCFLPKALNNKRQYLFNMPGNETADQQYNMLQTAKATAQTNLLVSRLDRNVDIMEFKKLCDHINGKPKAVAG